MKHAEGASTNIYHPQYLRYKAFHQTVCPFERYKEAAAGPDLSKPTRLIYLTDHDQENDGGSKEKSKTYTIHKTPTNKHNVNTRLRPPNRFDGYRKYMYQNILSLGYFVMAVHLQLLDLS